MTAAKVFPLGFLHVWDGRSGKRLHRRSISSGEAVGGNPGFMAISHTTRSAFTVRLAMRNAQDGGTGLWDWEFVLPGWDGMSRIGQCAEAVSVVS